jgi:O-acetylserine/cysteine efflux transporter
MAILATPQLFILSAVLETGQWHAVLTAGGREWGAVLFAGLGSTVIGYGLWYYLVARYKVSRIVPFGLLTPAIGVASGVLLLGEILTWQKIVGGLITVSGVAIIQVRRTAKQPGRDMS